MKEYVLVDVCDKFLSSLASKSLMWLFVLEYTHKTSRVHNEWNAPVIMSMKSSVPM